MYYTSPFFVFIVKLTEILEYVIVDIGRKYKKEVGGMAEETKVDVKEETEVVKEEIDIAGLIGELSAKIDTIADKIGTIGKAEEKEEVAEVKEEVQEKVDDATDDGELSEEEIEDLDKFLQG